MFSKISVALAFAAILAFVAPSAKAAPPDDACALITPAQVSAVVGVPMKDGQYVMPTKKETCTWPVTKSGEKGMRSVTLLLESLPMFQASKTPRVTSIIDTPVSGLGDEAHYVAISTNVWLEVKKGNVAFRVTVYSDLPVEAKQAMEKSLAQQILSKL